MVEVTVANVIMETADSCSLVFKESFPYRPGQFLTLRVPSNRTGSVARCYSLCTSPDVDEHPAVTVKRTPGGYASNWICDNAKPGTTFEALAPAGVFTPGSFDADLLLLAAGSGITPMMSIIKSTLARGSGSLTLFYANRDEHSVIFRDQLRTLTERHPTRLTVFHWLESVQGLPTTVHLRALTGSFRRTEALICGPKPFMSAARDAIDLPRSRIRIERFVSLSGNPFEQTAATEPTSDQSSLVEVELDGQRHRLSWPAQTKLLDLFLDNGIAAPYSCREGACSACACRLVSGEVKMLNNEVLEQEDLDDGIILACQSLPVTDLVEISYEVL
jgi:3-ketosteroid 9alpha-monooxygenase subunit B